MGRAPIDWIDLYSYAAMTGAEILPAEARIIMEMSRTYCVQAAKSKDMNCPAPFPDVVETNVNKGDSIKQSMQRFRAKQK